MPSYTDGGGNALYLIACGAPPAAHLLALIQLLQEDAWDVCLIATPAALGWLNADDLAAVTGHPVRSAFRRPDDPEFAPLGDAVLVCPASFNTINKWALGISDTLALGLLNEALGRQVPTLVVPWVNDALAAHPAYRSSLDVLDRPAITLLPAGSVDVQVDPARLLGLLPPHAARRGNPS